jgi:hypothetical protein
LSDGVGTLNDQYEILGTTLNDVNNGHIFSEEEIQNLLGLFPQLTDAVIQSETAGLFKGTRSKL